MSKRKRRRQQAAIHAHYHSEAPPSFGGSWFTRFAVAFLVIFLLLWLLAPAEPIRTDGD